MTRTPNDSRKAISFGYVMAGGASSRFGRDKALVEFVRTTMLERTIRLVSKSGVREVGVIGAAEKYRRFDAYCFADRWPGEGPLGGIVTALLASLANKLGPKWNLIVSCDMPFLTVEWLEYLVERALQSDAQVVLAQSTHGPEPLCACWRTDAVKTLEAAFESGVRKVTEGISLLRAEVLDEPDWKRFDSDGRLFWNMNTQADYEEARRILEKERI